MPRRKKPAVKHDRISAKIERWNASVEIAVNRDPLTPWQPTSPDDRVYQPEARLELEAVIITTLGKRYGHPIASHGLWCQGESRRAAAEAEACTCLGQEPCADLQDSIVEFLCRYTIWRTRFLG
jgi:hypothetical protein